ncbi:hypothetical protein EDB81DRAFT_811866, partial [Dactylonectria macrodidyma]
MTAPSSASESFLAASQLRRWWWWAGTTISSSPRSLTTCYLPIFQWSCAFRKRDRSCEKVPARPPFLPRSVDGWLRVRVATPRPLSGEDNRPVLTWSKCQRLSTSPEAGPTKGSFSILQPPPDLPARSGDVAVHKGDLRHSCSWTILKLQINNSTCPMTNSGIILR